MAEFIMGALFMFSVIAFIVVFRDYRRWCRERERYARAVARFRPPTSEWNNGRWQQ